jgi:hypothetical protein
VVVAVEARLESLVIVAVEARPENLVVVAVEARPAKVDKGQAAFWSSLEAGS